MGTAPLDLDAWFAPMELEHFTRTVLGRDPYFVPARPHVAARLAESLGIAGAQDLYRLRDPEVSAWLRGADGRVAAPPIPMDSARHFHDAGTTLLIRTIHEFAPHERRIADAFHLAPGRAKCQLFANRPGSVTPVHFDPVDVVTVQLTGRKTWHIAPNGFAPQPMDGWAPGESVYPSMRGYVTGPPPTDNPAHESEYVLEPGAVLHVPRGYWHRTSCDRDSISLHVLLVPPLRMDVLIAALRTELTRGRHWREAVYGLPRPDHVRADLRTLRAAVDRLDAHDLIQGAPPEHQPQPGESLVRAGQATLVVDGADDHTARVTITAYGFQTTRATSIELDARFLPACRWIDELATGDTIHLDDILRTAPSLTKTEGRELTHLLEHARLVRRRP